MYTWLSVLSLYHPSKTTLLGWFVGFVGDGGNIAVVTAIPLIIFCTALCVLLFVCFFTLLFLLRTLIFGCRDQPGPSHPFPGVRRYSAAMCVAYPGAWVT